MLIKVSELSPAQWTMWKKRWPNFLPTEPNLACPCCGELYIGPELIFCLDSIQTARNDLKRPLWLNSGHRCWHRNVLVGGVPLSQHKLMALDVSTRGYDRHVLLAALKRAGFSTFGLYKTFIHTDSRVNRRWYGKGGKKVWNG